MREKNYICDDGRTNISKEEYESLKRDRELLDLYRRHQRYLMTRDDKPHKE